MGSGCSRRATLLDFAISRFGEPELILMDRFRFNDLLDWAEIARVADADHPAGNAVVGSQRGYPGAAEAGKGRAAIRFPGGGKR